MDLKSHVLYYRIVPFACTPLHENVSLVKKLNYGVIRQWNNGQQNNDDG